MSSKRSRKQARGKSNRDAQDIPEDEQWRLIEQSGILKHVPRQEVGSNTDEDKTQHQEDTEDEESICSPLMEEIFNSILLIIPFTSLYIMMDM